MSEARAIELRHPEVFRPPLARRAQRWAMMAAAALVLGVSLSQMEAPLPRLVPGLGSLLWLPSRMLPPSLGADPAFSARLWGWALLETLAMALVGTLVSSLLATPLGFLAARNTSRLAVVRVPLRRLFDFIRGIDVVIWALVCIRAVGPGPFSGILALAISDTGTLSKLYSEAVENLDEGPADGLRSVGAGALQRIRFAYLPQVAPIFLSNTLYFFESNVRSSSILGFFGAGGLGFVLFDRIGARRWDEVGALLLLLLVTVAVIDALSHHLRRRLAGEGAAAPRVLLLQRESTEGSTNGKAC